MSVMPDPVPPPPGSSPNPDQYVQPEPVDRWFNWAGLLVSLCVVVVAFLMEVRPDGRVFFRWNPDHVLPELCGSKVMMNMECAGCGLTRSFIHLAAFRPLESWNVHRAGWMVAGLVLFQIPYRIVRLLRPEKRLPTWAIWLVPIIFACLMLHWVMTLFGI